MNRLRAQRATTCIYLQIKRLNETYFVLCDEYDPVESLKSRILSVLGQVGFDMQMGEEMMTTEDIRLYLKRRVSLNSYILLFGPNRFHSSTFANSLLLRFLTLQRLAMTSKCSTIRFCIQDSRSQTRRMTLRRLLRSPLALISNMTTMEISAPERKTKKPLTDDLLKQLDERNFTHINVT